MLNQIVDALAGDLVPRDHQGNAADGVGSVGTERFRFNEAHIKALNISKGGTNDPVFKIEPNDSGELEIKQGDTVLLRLSESGVETLKTLAGGTFDSAETVQISLSKLITELKVTGIGGGPTTGQDTGYFGTIPLFLTHNANQTYVLIREGDDTDSLAGADESVDRYEALIKHATNVWIFSAPESDGTNLLSPIARHQLSASQTVLEFLKNFGFTEDEINTQWPNLPSISISSYIHLSFLGAKSSDEDVVGPLRKNKAPTGDNFFEGLPHGILNPKLYYSDPSTVHAGSPFSAQQQVSGSGIDVPNFPTQVEGLGYFQDFDATYLASSDKNDGTRGSKGRVVIEA